MIDKSRFKLFVWLLVLMAACTSDVLPPPESPEYCNTITATYNTNVKPIIDESCAYSGCHNGAGGATSTNYSSYDLLVFILENGDFRSRVLGQKDDPRLGMPPNKSVYPESRKNDLTEEELQIIECWLNEGYPKN